MQSTLKLSSRLSHRELEVLTLIADGHSTKSIAHQLNIAYKTADTHRTRMMEKLGIHNAAGLVRYAIREGIIEATVCAAIFAGWIS